MSLCVLHGVPETPDRYTRMHLMSIYIYAHLHIICISNIYILIY